MKCANADIASATAAAKAADVAVLALGIDGDICGEGRDRMNITLPGQQKQLAEAVIAAAKQTVLLIFSGGLVDIGDLKTKDVAIVQGWSVWPPASVCRRWAASLTPKALFCRYPGATGGTAIAETVFGEQNRWGKLPFTWYNSKYTAASDFDNMNMTDGPGRTYKYLKDPSMALCESSSCSTHRVSNA